VPTYNAAGLLTGVKEWQGQATTDSSGNWTVSIASAGFTAPPRVFAQGIASSNAVLSAVNAITLAPTATVASGFCTVPTSTGVILGGTIVSAAKAPAGIKVDVLAVGV
jgi:hypothetical protein